MAWRQRLWVIIFEADTPAGKAFDVALLVAILVSVGAVLLESVAWVRMRFGGAIRAAEWFFTVLFTVEYAVRLACVRRPVRYATSFFGIIDLLAILPSYVSLLWPGSQSLLTIRALRLLRVFRVFKLARFLGEANMLTDALTASRHKVGVFLGTVFILVVILGSAMYLIEGAEAGFTSIPQSIYWAIVTLTTVGYGDLAPQTPLGKTLAAAAMILGYSIIAVPTGIVTAELVQGSRTSEISSRACASCLATGHRRRARFCFACGDPLIQSSPASAGPRPPGGPGSPARPEGGGETP
ncbi:MAG: ion transporter [Myxococcota bacterium]